jgi:hypothetical protein
MKDNGFTITNILLDAKEYTEFDDALFTDNAMTEKVDLGIQSDNLYLKIDLSEIQ